MGYLKKSVILFLILVGGYSQCYSDIKPGIPFVTNFRFEEYNASPQNWDAVQADNGIMYFANGYGILEFDGSSWQLIDMPNKTIVRSLDIDKKGTIYVGGYEEFGYLKPDINGDLKYVSLIDKIPENANYFQDVWTTKAINSKVFFQTYHSIFIYDNDAIIEIKDDNDFAWSFKHQGNYYTQISNGDLLIYKDSVFHNLKGSSIFHNDPAYAMLLYPQNKSLIITADGSFLICEIDTNNFKISIIDSIINDATAFVTENYFYAGINYDINNIILATFYNGALMIDQYGEPVMHMSKSKGLYDNNIRNLYKDRSSNIWLCNDRGISYIDMNLSLTIFNEYTNISGSVNSAIIFDDPSDNIYERLYVATIDHVFYKDIEKTSKGFDLDNFQKFKAYQGLKAEAWDLFKYKNSLLCATSYGVYELKDNQAIPVTDKSCWSFTPIKSYPNRLLVNLNEGFELIEYQDGSWKYLGKVKGFHEYAASSVFDRDNNLWLESVSGGIYKIKFSENYDSVTTIKKYNIEKGLPTNNLNYAFIVDEDLKIATEKGIYNFDKKQDYFYPDSNLNVLIGNEALDYIYQDSKKDIWYFASYSKSIGLLSLDKNGRYVNESAMLNDLEDYSIWDMYYHNDSNLFFCSPNGLIYYNRKANYNSEIKLNTLIRKVEIINNPNNIIRISTLNNSDSNIYVLNYDQNAIRFTCATPTYENVKNNLYSYCLCVNNSKELEWSEWTTQSVKEYSYLDEGKYVFHVKSRDNHKIEGNIVSFSFKILPPYYRTIVAYIIYIILFSAIVYYLLMLYTRQLKRANIKLEKKVYERTNAIRIQNDILHEHKAYIEKQRNDLQILNANKDKFFKILAHDLKSPFNTILGFSQLLVEKLGKKKDKENLFFAEFIKKSAASSFELLENLLTWSRIQGNNIKPKPEQIKIVDLIEESLSRLKIVAAGKKIEIVNKLKNKPLFIFADSNMIQTVLRNLITNAIKFSNSGQEIVLNAKDAGNNIVISVKDYGVGISKANIDKLFKVEENITTVGTNDEKGSGLGLILCHEFVKINKGTIWIESKIGEGSTFYISLPKTKIS